VIADYVQTVSGRATDFRNLGMQVSETLPDSAEIQVWGGGVVIFDQFGRAKYHITKALTDWGRQGRRLDYLVRNGIVDGRGRHGFSLGIPRGQRFAALHRPGHRAGEEW
jgi:hypothetical protein